MPLGDAVLLVFARVPRPGQVKTRLIPHVGAERAAAIYRDLLTGTLQTARHAGFAAIQLWLAGDRHPYFDNITSGAALDIYQQQGADLGDRMQHAFLRALRRYRAAILIGSDCPVLTVGDLKQARHALRKNDIVLGPARDGGYYLIGLCKNSSTLFKDIAWGKASVLSETRARIKALGWTLSLLTERWDVDDLKSLRDYLALKENSLGQVRRGPTASTQQKTEF